MSPKSKGRPKGRGRARVASSRGRLTRQLSPVDQVLHDARELESCGRMDAQLVASAWLGAAWVHRELGQREPEADLVRDLIRAARTGRKPAAYLALHALATIAVEPWAPEVVRALRAAPAEAAPTWAVDPGTVAPEQPVRAQRWSDPWGSEHVYMLRYTEPQEHVLVMAETTVGGRYVTLVEIAQQTDEPDDQIDDMTAEELSAAAALAEVADALWTTDLYWPPQNSPEYVHTRALAHWRTQGHRTEVEPGQISDDERRGLVDDFVAQCSPGVDPESVELLADTFVDFGDGYLHGGVLAWSPGEVERFMLDWVQRKVMLDPQEIGALPAVLAQWVAFALRRRGLAEEHIAPVVAAVHELAGEFTELEQDPSAGGPAKQIMGRLLAEGVDMNDKAALDATIRAYNAEQLARRVQEG